MRASETMRYITRNSRIQGGVPIVSGTRISVSQMLVELASGPGVIELADEFDIPVEKFVGALKELSLQCDERLSASDGRGWRVTAIATPDGLFRPGEGGCRDIRQEGSRYVVSWWDEHDPTPGGSTTFDPSRVTEVTWTRELT